jgi:hypothetical protein
MARSQGLISIYYNLLDGAEVEVSFHAIISEAHEVTTEITKFPVQTGFEISNHAIKKNRKVVIEAIVTNTPLVGQVDFGTANPSIYVFEALQTLVSSSVTCTVSTNLGYYGPVVFTKLTTKQSVGSMDSLHFTMTGEEIQVQETLNKTAPKVLSFTKVPEGEYQGLVDRLNCMGIEIEGKPEISEAEVLEDEDFSLDATSMAGVAGAMTFISKGKNAATGISTYEAHTSDTDYIEPPAAAGETSFFGLSDEANDRLKKGADVTSTCMTDGVKDLAVNTVQDIINTQMGKLENTLYGAKQDIIQMGGSAAGQALVGMGMDCVVAGVATALEDPDQDPCAAGASDSLPTADDAIFGLSNKIPKSQKLFKIASGYF